MAATVDVVSDGRILIGLGAGSYDAEHKAFGYATDYRVSRLEREFRSSLDCLTVTRSA